MTAEQQTTLTHRQRLAYVILGPVFLASSIGPAAPPPITPDKTPTPLPVPTATAIPEQSKLEKYLEEIRPVQESFVQIVSENDIFRGLKNFPADKRIEDAERYFPVYYAVWKKYGTHPLLASIIHVDESTNSRDENPDWYPDLRAGSARGMIRGAVQRYDLYHDDALVENAIKGYKWLKNYDGQRYTRAEGYSTNDVEELFFLGWKLSRDAKEYKDKKWSNGILVSDDEALKQALEQYSRQDIGKNRFNIFQKNKHLFANLFPDKS